MKVFWSWQSDTPGRTGRHFVRKALDDAVAKLKEAPEIEEPTLREFREALHVDSDRQGVPGSPDLAQTILEKIISSEVLIADVTPVSIIPNRSGSTGEGQAEKRNMDPNVAIELGYAMHVLSDAKILMVLNTWYGGREFLPFDLAHKAGPITYNLGPNSTNEEIRRERAQLTGAFVASLRPYLPATPTAKQNLLLVEAPSTVSRATYYVTGEELAVFGEQEFGDQEVYSYPDRRGFYLRVRPKFALPRPLSRADMNELARDQRIPLMWFQYRMSLSALNKYGAIVVERHSVASGLIDASTQLFESGELWGVNRRLLTFRERERQLGMKSVENVFRFTLLAYLKFMQDALNVEPPYLMEVGAVGLSDYRIVADPAGFDTYGPIHPDEFSFQREIDAVSDEALDRLLSELFNQFFELTGYRRPD